MSSSTPQGPGGPEYIESGHGTPVPPERSSGGSGRKKAIVAGGVVLGLAAVGGAAWAASSFLGTGTQPAEALPADTLAYASVDLDPSGGQKMAAISMLRKFPAFREETGLQADDDVRRWAFTEMVKDGECEGLDFADDVEPWLGHRMAVAAVSGDEGPEPVVALQVRDADAAEEGLATLRDTCGGGEGELGWAVDGDWALLAETDEIADRVAGAADDGSLADDETFQKWTGEAGDPGVASAYAAPGAARVLVEELGGLGMPGAYGGVDPMSGEPMSAEPMPGQELPPEVEQALADFEGMAATVRFDDGGLELEVAGNGGQQVEGVTGAEGGVGAVTSLPADTIAAVGMNFADGWFQTFAEQVAKSPDSGMEDAEDVYTELENMTGLALPEDAEVLTGDSVALALGSGFDLESMFNSADPTGLPLGLKIQGDAGAIEGVLDKIRDSAGQMAGPQASSMLESESEGDYVALSPNPDYRSDLAGEGSLGDSAAFESVVDNADEASAVFFVDFDANDDWLTGLAPEGERANIEPLSALGLSAWRDDDSQHAMLRLSTD
jgi:hypothetical protein